MVNFKGEIPADAKLFHVGTLSSSQIKNLAIAGISFPARNAEFVDQGDGISVPQYHQGAYIALAAEQIAAVRANARRKVVRASGNVPPQIWIVASADGTPNPAYRRNAALDKPLLGCVYMREVVPEVAKFAEDPPSMLDEVQQEPTHSILEGPKNPRDAATQAIHARAKAQGATLGAGAIAGPEGR